MKVTKQLLHKAFNVAGGIAAAALIFLVWFVNSGISTSEQIAASLAVTIVWLSRAPAFLAAANKAVDALPIPSDEAVTKPETFKP